jgi:hypothetical protein
LFPAEGEPFNWRFVVRMHRPSSRRPANPKPGEHLWSLHRAGREIECELRSIAPGAWECFVSDDDWLISNRRFPARDEALAHAEQERRALVREGWS